MKDQVLSINQMQCLESLGVDISKASMCYVFHDADGEEESVLSVHNEYCQEMSSREPVPTFTLQDILEIIPSKITSHPMTTTGGYAERIKPLDYYFCIANKPYTPNLFTYSCYLDGDIISEIPVFNTKEGEVFGFSGNIMESAYKMLVWLIENKHR